ncbi:hypothetical protein SSUST3_0817 [Streptococcus suis ST3]|nr:hypothetical protein SSUST3_0817 [Streptococcus suis ST3]AER17046.1 hypothetical protein SSUD9_0825 [Streptococcus suis D9]
MIVADWAISVSSLAHSIVFQIVYILNLRIDFHFFSLNIEIVFGFVI